MVTEAAKVQKTYQVDTSNLSLVLLQLALSEDRYNVLQAARLDVCRHIILKVPGCMRLLPFTVGKHEGLVVLRSAQQVHSVLVLLLSLATKPCHAQDFVLLVISQFDLSPEALGHKDSIWVLQGVRQASVDCSMLSHMCYVALRPLQKNAAMPC